MDRYMITATCSDKNGESDVNMSLMAPNASEAEKFFMLHMIREYGINGFKDIKVISPKPYLMTLAITPRECMCKGTIIPTHCDIHNKMF